MRILIQRVRQAHVEVEGRVVGRIGEGMLALVGFSKGDGPNQVQKLARKLVQLRIFADEVGKMNRSVGDIKGGILAVSQFTLYADTSRGNRPGFERSLEPQAAEELFRLFVETLRELHPKVETGIFRASMQVHLVNDGPVTILLEDEAPPNTGTKNRS